jgi:putative endonuclease
VTSSSRKLRPQRAAIRDPAEKREAQEPFELVALVTLGPGSRSTRTASHVAAMTTWWVLGMYEKQPAIYSLAGRRNGTLYIGVTSDFVSRISEHTQDLLDGFTAKYAVHRLVDLEFHDTMDAAIKREKRVKRWRRAWKIELIETSNPAWQDHYPQLSGLTDPNLTSEDLHP